MPKTIDTFSGEYAFLSNFYPSPVRYGRLTFPTVEHAFQAAKSYNNKERLKIRDCPTPGQAKRMGRKVDLVNGWEENKIAVMEKLVLRKFEDENLAKLLLETGNMILIEGNWWSDQFWGVSKGFGLNKLGQILMNVREQLKEQ